ncbi:MAG: DUF362 domain-containing protein [Candidatus Omnitrophota bacterium]|jgi:uncharacterized protein (DUF362 family)
MSKVSIVRCPDYDERRVLEAVKRAVDLAGGIREYVEPGMKVLLKPNLLSARGPMDAVDTHPEVVRAVVRLVKEAGATPIIGDSPGGYGDNIDQILEMSGMKAMAMEEGIELVKFREPKFVEGFPISRYVLDSDCFISIPKLKTHCITVLTAALKNTFGCVTGLYKAECHSRAPREDDFAKIIAKVHSIAKPDLTVLDGVMAMEGDGPSSGSVRKMNVIMAGPDAVAIDSCIAKMIGLDPMSVSVTKEAYKIGLGESNLSRIEVLGDDIEGFITKDFKMPQTMVFRLVPRVIANSIARLVSFKPYVDDMLCRRCNLCKVSCPVDAIAEYKAGLRVNYKKCIRCLCCHEVCPYKAIGIKRNLLTKLIWG